MKTLCVALLLLLAAAYVNAATMSLASMCRDQSPKRFGPCAQRSQVATCQVDFEWGNKGLEKNIVTGTLDVVTRKPVYANGNRPSPSGTVHNQTTFNTWFNDSPFTKNVPHNLTLTNTVAQPRIFGFDSIRYFPFDGKGWDTPSGSDRYEDLDGNMRNFHFCSEAHGRFAYKGGETFTFLGDDDVFVYINNKLALDLGGVHGPESGSFNLDDLARSFGLILGNNYRFDFFWCERHTLGSNVKLTTSLEIFCSYYDWCDICDGNGQSCCPAGACDDNNPCTTDLCAVRNAPPSCQNIPINCTAPDICNNAACDPQTGRCKNEAIICPDDGNKCTLESCDPARGGCLRTQKVCDDGQGLCTSKFCAPNNGTCIFTPTNCDDGNACTIDSCDALRGCVHTPRVCDDRDPCTDDTCVPATGCAATRKVCNDNNVCTTDSCSFGQCVFLAISCDDNNACTRDTCDRINGCQRETIDCDDTDKCTDDSCDRNVGCVHSPHSCDDNNACTTDTCDRFSGCDNQPVVCSDGDICTYDTCVPATGCSFPKKTCNDGNACTADSCGASQVPGNPNACATRDISSECNDNDMCTIDSCDRVTGCVHQPVTCPPATNPCDRVSCKKNQGCVTETLPANICNACYDSVNQRAYNCSSANLCAPRVCSIDGNGQAICVFSGNVTCDDGNACTTDACVPRTGQCTFTPTDCSSADACIVASCDKQTGVCSRTPVDCDDKNPCTVDTCVNGACRHTLTNPGCTPCADQACITTDYCNPNLCVNDQCVFTPVVCNDNNACTDDRCSQQTGHWNATCLYSTHDCAADFGANNIDACHPVVCDPSSGCGYRNVTCDDLNACTTDKCVLNATLTDGYTCLNDALCPYINPCEPNICIEDPAGINEPTCEVRPINCNDQNPCTTDGCSVNSRGDAVCVNEAVTCPFTDFCFPAFCNPKNNGSCDIKPVDCDDGVLCTIDSCNATTGECSNILNTCNDNKNCTIDSCRNDAVNSTTGCVNEDIICPETLCAVGSCDPILGCLLTPIYCDNNNTDFCTAKTCDESLGCLNVTRTCLLTELTTHPDQWKDDYQDLWKVDVNQKKYKDLDCFTTTCDPIISKCVVVKREPFGSDCEFAYLDQGQKAAILTAGAIAGVAIAAVVFAALAGFGAKKGYDAWVRMKDERMGAAATNPMYAPSSGAGTNALYGGG